MMKKVLGLAAASALLFLGTAQASTFFESCGGASANSTGAGSIPTVSGTANCAAFTVPAGQTLTAVELFLEGDYQSAQTGGNTLMFTFTISGGNAPGFSLTQLIDTASGNSGSSSVFTFVPTGGACINGQTWNGTAYAAAQDTADCPTTTGVPELGPTTYSSLSVTGNGSWLAGSTGLLAFGGESFNVAALFTYSALQVVPEPATLIMIGCGLIGLAMAGRRKFRA